MKGMNLVKTVLRIGTVATFPAALPAIVARTVLGVAVSLVMDYVSKKIIEKAAQRRAEN